MGQSHSNNYNSRRTAVLKQQAYYSSRSTAARHVYANVLLVHAASNAAALVHAIVAGGDCRVRLVVVVVAAPDAACTLRHAACIRLNLLQHVMMELSESQHQ